MSMKEENYLQKSTFVYIFPFQTKELSFLKNPLGLTKNRMTVFPVFRKDFVNCIENNTTLYNLKINNHNNEKKHIYITDEANKTKFKCFDYSQLTEIQIVVFADGAKCLILKCNFNFDVECEELIKFHQSIVRNYYKRKEHGYALGFDLKDSIYTLGDFESDYNVKFDFSTYQIQFLTQSHLNSKIYIRNYAEKYNNLLSNAISNEVYLNQLESNDVLSLNDRFVISSFLGTSISFHNDNDHEIDDQRNINNFHNEYLPAYLMAVNYKIIIEKLMIVLSELTTKEAIQKNKKYHNSFNVIQRRINEYKLSELKYDFLYPSFLNFFNKYYLSVRKGLLLEQLSEELNSNLNDSHDYIEFQVKQIETQKDRKLNFLTQICTMFGSLAMFVFAAIQIGQGFDYGKESIIISSIIATFILISYVILKIVRYTDDKKNKI